MYSTTATPDREIGIGSWSDDDFLRALHRGIAPEGRGSAAEPMAEAVENSLQYLTSEHIGGSRRLSAHYSRAERRERVQLRASAGRIIQCLCSRSAGPQDELGRHI